MGRAETATSHQEVVAAIARSGEIAVRVRRSAHSLRNQAWKWSAQEPPARNRIAMATWAVETRLQTMPAASRPPIWAGEAVQGPLPAIAVQVHQAAHRAVPIWARLNTERHTEEPSCMNSRVIAAHWTARAGRNPQVTMTA